jgi:hypothetical protein
MLTELHGGPSGGHLSLNNILDKVWKWYYLLQPRINVEKWCRQCDACIASHSP